ncbi:hypothetical protein IAQ61_010404 [Plenodomus lingam]|uniref:uncharacterized protein n=1 Tax=Leptosphaeria maculans TaxID=5022 RepID=UPI00332A7AB2|nr:hypothetical protein IAQ61_010404 [Plenodomus lingam]
MSLQHGNHRLMQDTSNFRPRHANIGFDGGFKIKIPHALPARPKNFNAYGKECAVTLNTFNVTKAPDTIVHQYDRVLLKKIWNSKGVKAELGEPANLWVWDGNKLAWSSKKLEREEFRIAVDLDQEEGRPTKAGARGNKHTIHLRRTRQVDFHHLTAFLNGQAAWSNECIDTINFLDHVMRESPSQKYTQIKKSFFQRGEQRFDLGGGVEAFKGVFASLRPVLDDKFNKSLSVNVDVANGTFWRSQDLTRAIAQAFNCSPPQSSVLKKDLRRFSKVGVSATHVNPPTQWTIDEFVNMDATRATFTDPDDRSKKITVADYFLKKYKIRVISGVPVVRMTKKIRKEPVYMPIDVLRIDPNQRYNVKLSDTQTSNMIKFAVTLPKDRWAAVQHGVRLLDWANDPYLLHYGLKVNTEAARVKARVLPSPVVKFGAGSKEATINPKDMIQGRWRLDGVSLQLVHLSSKSQLTLLQRKFAIINKDRPLKAWGVCCMYSTPPNFLFFIVNDRNVDVYRRIKKSCDIRFGVASQVLQAKHVMSASPQYISNVCMKVNAKLGGATCVAESALIPRIAKLNAYNTNTMVVGADVSHPAPGAGSSEAASFAAITMSADPRFVRYWAEVQTNGNRVEMVTTSNIDDHFGAMAKVWIQLLEEEVNDMKECFKKLGCKVIPKFTVVIAGKRHHIRFFPDPGKGDRNNNPLPGTLVESGCTHPFEFDFYLCSHVAIKGTARPIHYQCILNEGNWLAAELQQFIFEHSYHYVRSTTPVSLHPAVYYAHLAADRSRAHLNDSPVSSGKKETKAEQKTQTGSSSKPAVEIAPLMPLQNSRGLKDVMWYI